MITYRREPGERCLGITDTLAKRNVLPLFQSALLAGFVLVTLPAGKAQDAGNANASQKVPRIEKSACVVTVATDEAIDCSTLVTFENHDKPTKAVVRLPFVVFRSRSDHPKHDPVLWTAGGPGGGTLRNQRSGKAFPFLDDRDYIAFEQRGTEFAHPTLHCPEYIQATGEATERNLDRGQRVVLKLEAARACKERFVQAGIDLASYTTQQSADDIEDLRRLLGVPQWNLVGMSYSTRLDLEILRRHPASVRSMVLDSVLPPDVPYDELAVSNINRSLQLVIDNCAVDAACERAYPNLSEVLADLLRRFDTEHPVFELKSPRDEKPVAFSMTSRNIMDAMYVALYSPGSIPTIPYTLWQAHNRRYDTLKQLLQENLGASGFAWGMRLSVWCHDQGSLTGRTLKAMTPELGGFSAEAIPSEVCQEWGVAPISVVEARPVVSDVPVLIFAGEYDPNTPTEWAHHVARTLKSSYIVQIPGMSHGLLSLDQPCGRTMVTSFLQDPSRMPPADCVARVKKATFVVAH